jgi:hypothetical protein
LTIRINEQADPITVELDDQTDWLDFTIANEEAIIEQYGSPEKAFKHLCDGGLIIGGGAAPEVRVYFVEE